MIIKKLVKMTSCVMAGIVISTLSGAGAISVYADDNAASTQVQESLINDGTKKEIKAKERVSVHDPSIVKADGEYYVFGSHIDAAKSSDLQNWTKFTNSYQTPGNVIFGDLSSNLAESFKWAGENDSDCKGGFAVWAPNVTYNKDYVNEDGSKGAYMMYYCTSSTYKRSAIGFAVSKDIEGPYTYGNTIVYSGFTDKDAQDSGSSINTNYNNTNIKSLIDNNVIDGVNESWFSNKEYNTSYAPNAIDPEILYDEDGTMWMSYGSWSGGIYMLKMNPETGMPIYPGRDENVDSENPTDRYFGTRIAGGYTKSGEGAEIVYDKSNGYYYLYMSYAGLAADGGYNIRMFRSKNPEGPYVDAEGNNAALSGNVDNSYCGIKLIGNYKFNCQDVGYKAAGHNSSFIDDDGQMYLIYHQRFNDGTETHEVRVHQMFINEEGWPCTAPYENSGDKISESGYSKDEIIGDYEFINHGTDSTSAMINTMNIRLNEDNTVSGDAEGTWESKNNSYYMNIKIDGVTYKGIFFKQQDESGYENKVMTFSAIGENNTCIWGSKLELNDDEAVDYIGKKLENVIPSNTKSNIKLPLSESYDTKISWSSSNTDIISSNGKVTRTGEDSNVTLTASVKKGNSKITKSFNVLVKGKLDKLDKVPSYKYNFNEDGDNQLVSSGSINSKASLIGSAKIDEDSQRGKILKIMNDKGVVNANYLALPDDTFANLGENGFSIGMWVNVNKDNPDYFEHSALFEADKDGQYPMTRISANLYGRINADAFSDATEISKPLESNTWQYVTYTVGKDGIVVYVNGEEVSRQDKDISACFQNNILSQINNVRVGSGAIWGDADIAEAEFDDIAIFDCALSDKEAEALYNEENK
ncbi:MAG: family 43 glycosylhydrolase [Clostridium sp.]|nr:family 43 glycosylhydrolase [Clostridium sp.]